jgi:repressor LexA
MVAADPEDVVELPLLGQIAAGRPIEVIPNAQTISVPRALLGRGRTEKYVLQVRGNSMVDDGIFDGDYVIVERRNAAQNGETVVALIGGHEVTLKRFYVREGGVELVPANSAHKPLFIEDGEFSIQGVVVGVFRRFD